jgi:hypothetical protein
VDITRPPSSAFELNAPLLLYDVRQFVREQAASSISFRRVHANTENDVLPGCEGVCADC